MKNFYIFLIGVFMVNGAMAQWVPQNSGTTKTLYCVTFTEKNTGFAVGDSGTILKTTDGGTNWGTQESGTIERLISVHFPSIDTGWVVGHNGTILKTIDGGNSWHKSTYGGNFSSVYFINGNIGYIGSSGISYFGDAVYKTSDGGSTWNIVSQYYPSVNGSISFLNPDTGCFFRRTFVNLTVRSELIKTTDGGGTWSSFIILESDSNWVTAVYFTDYNTGYAVGGGNDKTIFKTLDGGITWSCQYFGQAEFASVHFPSPSIGYTVGKQGLIMKTNNSGATWANQLSGTGNYLMSVFFTDDTTGYIVGNGGTILKTTFGGGVGLNEIVDKPIHLTIFPNPSSTQLTIETSALPFKSQLSILNLNGQEVLTRQITESKTQLNVSNLPSGVYFVRFTGEKTVQVGKFVKQ
jgi:photosystem II stability/assembly factor-like uncharacterized protein